MGVTLPPPCELRPATELGPGGMDTAMSAPGRPLRLAVLVETPAEQEPLRWCRGNILLASFEAAPMLDMACISPTTGWEGGGVAGCRLPLRSLVRAGFCVLAGEAADAVSAGSRPLELPLVSTSFSALAAMREESLAPIVNGNLQEGCHLPGQAGCPHLTPADLLCAVLHYRRQQADCKLSDSRRKSKRRRRLLFPACLEHNAPQ